MSLDGLTLKNESVLQLSNINWDGSEMQFAYLG